MSDRFDDDMMEDLLDEQPSATHALDEFDEAGETVAFDEAEDLLEDLGDDGFEEPHALDGEEAADEFEEAVTDALEAEDADEFFGGLGRILKKVGRGVGSVARVVAPIASMIPTPYTQLIGRAAGMIGKVMADEGDEMDAFDGLADFADEEDGVDALAPAIAGVAIRSALKHQAARIPRVQRRELVKLVSNTTRQIARKHGPRALVAVPAIVEHARKYAVRRRLPAKHLPELVARTARHALRSPTVLRKLVQAGTHLRSPHARGSGSGLRTGRSRYGVGSHGVTGATGVPSYRSGMSVRGGGGGGAASGGCAHCRRRTYHLSGPVTLTINRS